MKTTNEKDLIIKKENLINKIYNFFRNIFKKNKVNDDSTILTEVDSKIYDTKDEFESNLKIDSLKLKLLGIQENLSKNGINEENLVILTKDLTTEDLIRLKELYIDQNERLKDQLNMYKNKILILKEQ